MREISNVEIREISGGASKYVYCPICGYRKKNSWWERLAYSNRNLEMRLQAVHGYGRNGYGRNTSKSVH